MKKTFILKQSWHFLAFIFASLFLLTACEQPIDPNVPPQKGQSSFYTTEVDSQGDGVREDGAPGSFGATEGRDAGASSNAAPKGGQGAPSGRTGTVEEADLYRVHGNYLYYLNTYKGLTIFDLSDRRHPKKLSSLPVFGYPIEMFVDGKIAYAIVRDALYLLKVNGKFEFKRRHVSQLVSIDISDPHSPKVLQRLDIKGQLREGVSRKIDKTIYVVSYISRYYWWGWSYSRNRQQKEQATVYSFNIENPLNIREVQHLDLITDRPKPKKLTGGGESYYFSGITISATANTLLVGENWHYSKYSSKPNPQGCSEYENYKYTRLSIIDISDPKGKISIHTRFKVRGQLSDQFKQTYIYDEKTKKGTYFGIFQRREWKRENCRRSESLVKNTFVSVDISDGAHPKVLDELVFGKPNETVRGSLFDRKRRILYAITAVRRDPFYAISFADPSKLKILSEIDGLSGDINLFRFIKNGQFLLAVGRDNSSLCSGFDKDSDWRSTKLAVSIIDVRNVKKARLVQRKCIAIKNAAWVSSQINWNLDQAHKMIGMYDDGKTSLLTVPVSYYTRNKQNVWWYYQYKTAIGIMKWDLSKYDDTKSEKEQNVLENIATIIHPKGTVKRTIITKLNNQRSVINLSDTHISLVDLQDLRQPQLLSTFEIAPYIRTVYRFGDYLVEQVNLGRYYTNYNEFRVKKIGSGNINDAPTLATIKVGRVRNVIRWKNYLLLFSYALLPKKNNDTYPRFDYQKSIVRVYDFSNPAKPRIRGSLVLPATMFPYYYFYCGAFDMIVDCMYPYYYYGSYSRWVSTSQGLAFMNMKYDYSAKKRKVELYFLNFSNPDKPTYKYKVLKSDNQYLNIVSLDESQFFLVVRKIYKKTKDKNGRQLVTYIYYAEPWSLDSNGTWKASKPINVPGQLMKAFRLGKTVKFLTRDYQSVRKSVSSSSGRSYYRYQLISRLFLLEKQGDSAILKDTKVFKSWQLHQLLIDKNYLFIKARHDWYWMMKKQLAWYDYSDYLMIFDLSKNTFKELFSKALRTYSVKLAGIQDDRLFINLPGEGLLVVDVSKPAYPRALHFERTLGWASNIEFSKDKAFIAAGYFGIYQLDLNSVTIPTEPM